MITDAGIEAIASNAWLSMLANPILGTNATPTAVRRDSGAVTFTQSGTTLTASSGFFVAGDTGRLFKWGTGSAGAEMYLTYVSATQCTTSASATVSTPDVGTIWYVNTAALLTPITGLTWSVDTGAANNYSTWTASGDTATNTCQCTRISSALTAPATITEIAFNSSSTNSSVFDRDIIAPSIALVTGDQARVVVQLIRTYSSITAVATGNVGTGCDTTGQMQIEWLSTTASSSISQYDASAAIGINYPLEPMSNLSMVHAITGGAIAFQAFSTSSGTSRTGTARILTNATYGAGTRVRDKSITFTISQANGTIYGLALMSGFADGATGSFPCAVTWKFTTPATKTSSQTLTVAFRFSWSRVLTN